MSEIIMPKFFWRSDAIFGNLGIMGMMFPYT